jgi:hypothetical protein
MSELKNVADILEFYIAKIILDTKKNLESRGRIASHALEQSIRTAPIQITKQAFGETYTAVVIMEDYYEWVDKGRKPGKQPPIADIIKWIKYKPIKIDRSKLGDIRERGVNKRKPYTIEDLVKQRAQGIARKIGLKGTRPSNFYSDVVNENLMKDLNSDLSKALKKDVEVIFKNFNDTKEFLQGGTKRYGNNN